MLVSLHGIRVYSFTVINTRILTLVGHFSRVSDIGIYGQAVVLRPICTYGRVTRLRELLMIRRSFFYDATNASSSVVFGLRAVFFVSHWNNVCLFVFQYSRRHLFLESNTFYNSLADATCIR